MIAINENEIKNVLTKQVTSKIEFIENKTDDNVGILLFSSGKNLWKLPCSNPKIVSDVKIDDGEHCLSIEKEDFVICSDHNRAEMSITQQRIESRQRMINGTMRSYHIADKVSLSVSWNE
jgi:hypothetical protein